MDPPPPYGWFWVRTYHLNEGQMMDFAAMNLLSVDQLTVPRIYQRLNWKMNPNEWDMILKEAVDVPERVLFVAKVMENLSVIWIDLSTLIQISQNHFVELFEVELSGSLDCPCVLDLYLDGLRHFDPFRNTYYSKWSKDRFWSKYEKFSPILIHFTRQKSNFDPLLVNELLNSWIKINIGVD